MSESMAAAANLFGELVDAPSAAPTAGEVEAAVFDAHLIGECEDCMEFHADKFIRALYAFGFEVVRR